MRYPNLLSVLRALQGLNTTSLLSFALFTVLSIGAVASAAMNEWLFCVSFIAMFLSGSIYLNGPPPGGSSSSIENPEIRDEERSSD